MDRIDTRCVEDIKDTDTRPAGWWTSADGQGEINMTGSTLAESKAKLLAQCGDDEQRANILSGYLQVLS